MGWADDVNKIQKTDDTLVLIQASKDHRSIVREAVACNPHTPLTILQDLLKDQEFDEVLASIASNPSIPSDWYYMLVALERPEVTRGILSNPKCPGDILTTCAKAASSNWGWVIAQNPNAPEGALVILYEQFLSESSYFGEQARETISKHPNCPEWIRVADQVAYF